MKLQTYFITCALALFSTYVIAQTDELAVIKNSLLKIYPEAKEAIISKAPIDGLYQVADGAQIMYISKDMKYVINGEIYDMTTRKNITDVEKGSLRLREMDKLGEDKMVVFNPSGETKHTITVFTDLHCPYCRKFHSEIQSYLDEGIKVRYLFMPFKGAKSAQDSVNIWCSKDRQTAFTDANNGKFTTDISCPNPIAQHQELGAEIGVKGTPAIILDDGTLLPGYIPAKKLADQLKIAG